MRNDNKEIKGIFPFIFIVGWSSFVQIHTQDYWEKSKLFSALTCFSLLIYVEKYI